jgi:hypothetical protein
MGKQLESITLEGLGQLATDANALAQNWGANSATAYKNIYEPIVNAYKTDLSSRIVDTKAFVDQNLEAIKSDAKNALSDNFFGADDQALVKQMVPKLEYLRETNKSEFEKMGGEGILAIAKGLDDGSMALTEAGRRLGEKTGEAYTTALGAAIDPNKIKAQQLLSSPDFWKMNGADQEAAIKQYVGNVHTWFTGFLTQEASYNNQLIDQGLKADTESWDRAQKLFTEHSDWFTNKQAAHMEAMQQYSNYMGGIGNVSNDIWSKFWEGMASGDKTTKPDTLNQAVEGYNQLQDAVAGCQETFSNFGNWQETNSDKLFQGSYIGPTSGYKAWKDAQNAAANPNEQKITFTANTGPIDASVAATQRNLDALIKASDPVKVGANTSAFDNDVNLSKIAASQPVTIPVYYNYENSLNPANGPIYMSENPMSLYGSFAEGTEYVPITGPYLLHQGEKVTPAGQSGGNSISIGPTIIEGNINGVDDFEDRMNQRDSELMKKVNQALTNMAKAR